LFLDFVAGEVVATSFEVAAETGAPQ